MTSSAFPPQPPSLSSARPGEGSSCLCVYFASRSVSCSSSPPPPPPPVRVPGPLTARSPSGIPIKQGPQLPMRKASISFIASLRHGSVSGTQRRARCIIGSWRGWLGEGLLLVKVCSRIPYDKSQSVI